MSATTSVLRVLTIEGRGDSNLWMTSIVRNFWKAKALSFIIYRDVFKIASNVTDEIEHVFEESDGIHDITRNLDISIDAIVCSE